MKIPTKYLCKMGDYDITINGVRVKAKLVDSARVMEQLVPTYFGNDDIFGVDLKQVSQSKKVLVICGESGCLILLMYYSDLISPSLKTFLNNYKDYCFVRPFMEPLDSPFPFLVGVSSCELAARVLKKPALMKEKSLEVVAQHVGVHYNKNLYMGACPTPDSSTPGSSTGSIMKDYDDTRILTSGQVKLLAYDAFTSYRIASRLLLST